MKITAAYCWALVQILAGLAAADSVCTAVRCYQDLTSNYRINRSTDVCYGNDQEVDVQRDELGDNEYFCLCRDRACDHVVNDCRGRGFRVEYLGGCKCPNGLEYKC